MNGSADRVKAYLSRNWFKLGLALLLVFIILKKDLSFQINLRSPVRMEEPVDQPPQPVREEKTEERLTDNREASPDPKTEDLSQIDRFEFPSILGEVRPQSSAYRELTAVREEDKQAFLKRFAHVAESEQRKFGIPASVILANSLLISQAGTRDMARQGNNYFALPCTDDWQGATGTYQGSCYRHYENAWTSFRDHSLFLTTGRLASLRQLTTQDFRAWAKALEKAGFSEQKDFARQLIQIIEEYRLYELDSR